MCAGHVTLSLCWFSRHRLLYFVRSALDFGEFKCFNGSFYRNRRDCPCLFYLFTNTTLNHLGFGMLTIGMAMFHILVVMEGFCQA